MELSEFEKDVIRMAADLPNSVGEREEAVGACIGPLYSAGYLKREFRGGTMVYTATEKGIQAVQ